MRRFNHATILSPSFHKERLAQCLLFVTPKTDQEFRGGGGVLSENLGEVCSTLRETLILFQTEICDFPCPISDLIRNLIPYFRPEEALEPGA